MSDNTPIELVLTPGATVATIEVSNSGDTAVVQLMALLGVSGSEGAYTTAPINGDAANGMDVDVTRSALPAGAATSAAQATAQTALDAIAVSLGALDNAVGGSELQVDVLTLPAVTISSLPAVTGTVAITGTVGVTQSGTWDEIGINDSGNSITVDQPTGTNLHVVVDSGTVTANAGSNLNTSLLALEAGGNLAAAAASLSVLDDWDETDRLKANTIVGQAGVQGNSGAVSANTQRVVLATDVALPAGTNAIGKLSANSGIDIGDVDVITAPLPTGGAITTGTTSITTTASIQVHAGTACKEVIVQNDPDNVNDMVIGNVTTRTIQLRPGEALTLPVSNVNLVYAQNVTSSTQQLNWISIV